MPYVTQGSPEGAPVAMLHGLADSWRSFELPLPHLPDAIHAFAPPLRGHVGAGRPESGYGPNDFSGDVAAYMDAMGLDAAVIVGHSLGSLIAQRSAVNNAECVELVLLGGVRSLREVPRIDDLHTPRTAWSDRQRCGR